MANRRLANYSVLIRREGERLLECLQDPKMEIMSCVGWEGMGRWGIAEYAVNSAMESHLFDVLIWVNLSRDELKSRWKLQMRIAECLGIQSLTMDVEGHREEVTNIDIAMQIYEKLKHRKFLLVLGGASWECEQADLAGLGVPVVSRWSTSISKVRSKVVLIGKWKKIKSDHEFDIINTRDGTPSASDAWDLFREEATLAAHSPSIKGYFSPDNVMNILLYSLLRIDRCSYRDDKAWIVRHLIAEEFIGGQAKNDEVFAGDEIGALLTELTDRSILKSDDMFLVRDKNNAMIDILNSGMDGKVENFHHRFWIGTDSLPKEDGDKIVWGSIQRMSLDISSYGYGRAINLPPSPKSPSLLTLILHYDRHDRLELPPTFFNHMESLRVLDLDHSSIICLPPSLSSLRNLKLLMLRRCEKLKSLPTSLRDLKALEFLDASNCKSLTVIPEESFEFMDKLRILDLSYTKIHSLPSSVSNLHNLRQLLLRGCYELTNIPEKCFEKMLHLDTLDLSLDSSLKSLPSSFSNLVSVKKINLSFCSTLETGVGPQSLKNLTSLEVLDLSSCSKLEDVRDASFEGILPKLRHVYISYTHTPNRLSFRGCSIEILGLFSLEELKVLDLSGAKFKTLYLDSINGKYSLECLDILPAKNLDVLSEELNWGDNDVGARIWVSNPNFFRSTLHYSRHFFDAPCFSRFYIRISPYEEEGCMPMTMDKIQNIHLKRNSLLYRLIYYSHRQTHLFPDSKTGGAPSRHFEICGGNSSPQGVDDLLAHTELITLYGNDFVESLSDMCKSENIRDMKECRIGSCRRIENMFSGDKPDLDILTSLEVIWASDLLQLTALCRGVYGGRSFALLKHIYLQFCPRLVTLFTSGVYLQSLQTLDIRFCSRLENVFQQELGGEGGLLRSLCSLCLVHLPKLKSVCNGVLPQLRKVRIRKCPKLKKLPRCSGRS